MNHERIDELLALAALGELDPADEAELDRLLDDDSDLAAELDADQATAASIQAAAAEPPPAALRASILDAIADVPQEPADPPAVSPDIAPAVSLDVARQRRSRRWQPLVAAAAMIGLVMVGAVVVNRGDDTPSFAEVNESDDASSRTLDGSLGGVLRVVHSASVDAIVVDGQNLDDVGPDETYQLWLVDDSGATSVGTFRPDDAGRVMETFVGIDPSDFVIGVTVEPTGGSDEPTLPIVASA